MIYTLAGRKSLCFLALLVAGCNRLDRDSGRRPGRRTASLHMSVSCSDTDRAQIRCWTSCVCEAVPRWQFSAGTVGEFLTLQYGNR